MSDVADEAEIVQTGPELDAVKLTKYLEGKLEGVHGILVLEQFSKGYSNLTYLVRAGEREYVLRRPPHGVQIKSAHDMGREFKILSNLADVYEKVPRPLLYCGDESIIGAPFYVMERVRGVILRARIREGIELRPERMTRISEMVIDTLAEIHAIDYAAIGLGDLGNPVGYIQRQVQGWAARYAKAETDTIPDMHALAAWLEAHRPEESGTALLHNDYKYDNVVIDPAGFSRIIAVLDWEMATLGDPLMDLGTALGYWIEADDPPVFQQMRFGPTYLAGNLSRRELVDRYAEKTGRDVSNIHFYYVFALFKMAVVAQQLYKRFRDGHTTEERYKRMLPAVTNVSRAAMLVIDRGRIDQLKE
ncbi:phosphotransferase family protein [bacterium]|nr:MAG: phosphotransferase family protein [bacterium]